MKKIMAVLLSLIIIFSSASPVYADNSTRQLSPVLKNFITSYNNGDMNQLIERSNYAYMNFAVNFRSSVASQYLIQITDKLINTGYEPDERKYIEVLSNIILTYDSNNASKISYQAQLDDLKGFKEYAIDAKDAAVDLISVLGGNNRYQEALTVAIDGISTLIDNTDNWVEALYDLDTILQDYSNYDFFLEVLEDNSAGELKSAASKMRNSLSSVIQLKLESYAEVSEENYYNYGEFIFSDIFIKMLKNTKEYANDETIKFLTDEAETYIDCIGVVEASWNLGLLIGKTLGNLTVGGENLITRVLEIEALYDISCALQSELLDMSQATITEFSNEKAEYTIRLAQMLIDCRIRGEYCIYSILVSDAALLSWGNKATTEDARAWYDDLLNRLLSLESRLILILDISADTELESFAKKQEYLFGENYNGFLRKERSSTYSPFTYDISEIPVKNVSWIIRDFDNDGDNELLIIGLNNEHSDDEAGSAVNNYYSLDIKMYEIVDGIVTLSDEMNLFDEGGYISTALACNNDDYTATVDCYLYGNDTTYIAVETTDLASMFADGRNLNFMSITYSNNCLEIEGSAHYSGSDGIYDLEYMEELDRLGLRVSWDEIFYQKKYVSNYVDNYYDIGRIETSYLISHLDAGEWIENESDKLKCTVIHFCNSEELEKYTRDITVSHEAVPENYPVLQIYQEALSAFLYNELWPDGREVVYDHKYHDFTRNQFVVYDIDGDGREELMISFNNTYTYAQTLEIYEYDERSGEMRQELIEYPNCVFYDNGYIWVGASHNQSPSDFWPFSLLEYDDDSDTYVYVGSAYAIDKKYDTANFPDSVDKNGNGRVYYYSESQNYGADTEPVDDAIYEEWFDSCVGNAKELDIPWKNITIENIECIVNPHDGLNSADS